MMFQSYALFPHLTVWENVAFGLKRHGTAPSASRPRSSACSPWCSSSRTRSASRTSSRAASSSASRWRAAWRWQPRLLLLDEPLGALDRKLRDQTQFELHSIIKSVGVTCVLVTHDQEEAMTMADRIAVMSDGRFVQVGAPREIYETPGSRFVADFIGTVNLFDGTLVEDEPDHCVIDTPAGRFYVGHGITGVKGQRLSVALRPEKIDLAAQPPARSEANCLKGRVMESAYFGAISLYRITLDDGSRLQVSVPNSERHGEVIRVGTDVYATCSPDALVVLPA